MASQTYNLMQRGVHVVQIVESYEQPVINNQIISDIISVLRNHGVFDNDEIVQNYIAPQVQTIIPSV